MMGADSPVVPLWFGSPGSSIRLQPSVQVLGLQVRGTETGEAGGSGDWNHALKSPRPLDFRLRSAMNRRLGVDPHGNLMQYG